MTAHMAPPPAPPIGLLVELTHRCPLGCPYCSNPLALERPGNELDGETWKRVFSEAAALGALHVHLSGGEPTARRDIVDLTGHASKAGLYTNLITSGIGVSEKLTNELADCGLDHAQLSFQGADKETNDRLGHYAGSWERKRAFAGYVIKAGLPLTINAVIHRANLHQVGAFIDLAVELGARRLEVAHTQYYGWALLNRAALMPPRKEVEELIALVEAARVRLKGELVIDMVVPDYYARYPKPCAGGWGRVAINVSPSGKALPCHAAESIPGLEFWNVRDHALAEIWRRIPLSRRSAARNGCANPVAPASGARSTGAGAAARLWRSPAMRATPIPPATSRPTTSVSWRRRWPSPNPATARFASGRTRRRSRPNAAELSSHRHCEKP